MREIYIILLMLFSSGYIMSQGNKPNHQLDEWESDSIPLGYKGNNPSVLLSKSNKSFTGNTSMKITFSGAHQKERNLFNDVIGKFPFSERPDSLIGIISPEIALGDTLLIVATLFKDQIEEPVGESVLEITGIKSESFEHYQSPIEYFTAFEPDSLQIDILFIDHNSGEESVVYIDFLNFSYNKIPFSSSKHYEPIKLYPNPTSQGHIYSVQNPGTFDRIFVKNISTDKIIFNANKSQLEEREIKIDLGDAGVGEYYVIFQNQSTTIRRRIEIK